MEQLEMNSLSEIGGPRIYLRDDGLNGDSRADDGVYTGLFADTSFEGSYTFKARATGHNLDGVTFDRTNTLSEYVKFIASSTESHVEFVSIEANKKEKTATATIKVTPIDEFGSYMGPFRGEPIRLWTSIGVFEPSYMDNEDGSYSYTLIYPLDSTPLLSLSVGNVVVTEQVPIVTEEPDGIDLYWILLLIVIMLLVLIIIIRYLKRSS